MMPNSVLNRLTRTIVTVVLAIMIVLTVLVFIDQQHAADTVQHHLCTYFYAEATSPVTLTKTSAFGVTDIVNARYTLLQLNCVSTLPPPSPDLVILAKEFHVPFPRGTR